MEMPPRKITFRERLDLTTGDTTAPADTPPRRRKPPRELLAASPAPRLPPCQR